MGAPYLQAGSHGDQRDGPEAFARYPLKGDYLRIDVPRLAKALSTPLCDDLGIFNPYQPSAYSTPCPRNWPG